MTRRHLSLTLVLAVLTACGATDSGPSAARGEMPEVMEPDTNATAPAKIRLAYGDEEFQFGDLHLPGGAEPAPVVVLIHGGFWRNPFDLTLMDPLAADLVGRGYAVWNVEYRRLGDAGGGWPGTFEDVAAAVDFVIALAEERPVDPQRTAVVGHSAGGHLALWAAGRSELPDDAPGSGPAVVPIIAIGQGAVVDLAEAAAAALGSDAVTELLGGSPDDVPDRYDWATPRLATGPSVVSIVGSDDTIVPPRYSADSDRTAALDVVEILGADHFDLIDPDHEAWQAVITELAPFQR